ncbi:hypothetical protein SG34_021625 [Thalassomonas viridans]|uniref:NolW-like domain-containing protein n=1 Tax=Thalassomonas viridans TaxID=137584 RepID=A0AAF0C822_9GAMM|nr:secretin N-terminal domain-containing protein [Thalassomonas viridans]WDE03946.1 hypothetical protein SG34_021625 [Thalassomonas viridans]
MNNKVIAILAVMSTLSACSNVQQKLQPKKSFLVENSQSKQTDVAGVITPEKESSSVRDAEVKLIKPFAFKQEKREVEVGIIHQFSDSKMVKIAADELPLNEFLHYVMGEVLGVSYILGEGVKDNTAALTLNLQESVSHRKLYSLIDELLAEREYVIRFNDGIYYIHQAGKQTGKGDIVFGYGNRPDDVPLTSEVVWQMAPFDYGFNGTLQLTLSQLANVKVYPDSRQNMLLLQGKRGEIIKALEFMRLVDKPKLGQRQIAMYKTVFVDSQTLIDKLSLLLTQEGISVGLDKTTNSALSIVSLPNMGAITFFANKSEILDRALFWVKSIDQPEEGNSVQYFIYPPRFSRAADLGVSLEALLGAKTGSQSKTSLEKQNQQVKKNVSATGISSSNIGLVVDERANTLIFQTTGEEYRKLLPLIRRLDIMPKQVMLEVVIAEVQLIDSFKNGVEFNLTNNGAELTGGFNLSSGATGLSYALTGTRGKFEVDLFEKNTNIEVLSRPSLVVRDGVTAAIVIGDDIPTVGEIVSDPVNGNRSSVVYRKTGVELEVTPTINAQGVVIMEIAQKISNQAESDSTVAGSPIIFERSINTEVVAESGQTIVLGGLISKDTSITDTRVPVFSDLPFLGKLFDGKDDSVTKKELVVLVTPKVLESNDEWIFIKNQLAQGLEYITLDF